MVGYLIVQPLCQAPRHRASGCSTMGKLQNHPLQSHPLSLYHTLPLCFASHARTLFGDVRITQEHTGMHA